MSWAQYANAALDVYADQPSDQSGTGDVRETRQSSDRPEQQTASVGGGEAAMGNTGWASAVGGNGLMIGAGVIGVVALVAIMAAR